MINNDIDPKLLYVSKNNSKTLLNKSYFEKMRMLFPHILVLKLCTIVLYRNLCSSVVFFILILRFYQNSFYIIINLQKQTI